MIQISIFYCFIDASNFFYVTEKKKNNNNKRKKQQLELKTSKFHDVFISFLGTYRMPIYSISISYQ